MESVKRWAFVPLLAIVMAVLGGMLAQNGGHSLTAGNIVGLIASVPVAFVIERRRRRRRLAR